MTVFAARLRALALILIAALAFAIAPVSAAHASGPGSATFTITADGAPVAFSGVAVFGPEFRFGSTDPGGKAFFTDLALGDYTFSMSSTPTHQAASFAFSLTTDSPHVEQTIALTPWPTGTGTISGTVTDSATGDPLSGVTVQVSRTDAPGPSADVVTDSAGQFQVTGLAGGNYNVAVWFVPGHFSGSTTVEVADGGSATANLSLLAADSTITGRLVDPEGNGIANLWVGAILQNAASSVNGQTDADGYFTLTGAGAGLWQLGVSADSQWERYVATVQVEAASTTSLPDIVLVPRFTGTVSGIVSSSDGIPESQIGGFFDICVTVVDLDGTPVPGANTLTGGDSFYYFWVAPGDYTVLFEDCDPDRTPHRYQSTYLGGSTTLAGATIVTVETAVDTWLDTTYLQPRVSSPEPTHDAEPVRAKDLEAADEDLIDVPSAAHRGETVEVAVGNEYAGQWVSAWLHPHATQLGGWHQVSSEGTIEITVPSHHPVGLTDLVVQDADDDVIGWTELRVLQRLK